MVSVKYRYEVQKIRMEPGSLTILTDGARITHVIETERYGRVMEPWYIITAVIETPVPDPKPPPAAPETNGA
jgi:hypothetical protein